MKSKKECGILQGCCNQHKHHHIFGLQSSVTLHGRGGAAYRLCIKAFVTILRGESFHLCKLLTFYCYYRYKAKSPSHVFSILKLR